MINVTKTFLPPKEDYEKYLNKIWESRYITNQGPLVWQLQSKLSKYLNVQHIHYVTNGTVALQLALQALDITDGEVITTPFTYVATSSSILWQKLKPVFVDIEPDNFTIDVNKIEEKITTKTNIMVLAASLITPSFGLIFWMLIGFGILVFILAKYAWPVITKSIAKREEYIETQLAEAEKIKNELANMEKKHDEMMAQTKAERDKILADARKISEKMYEEAKLKADNEATALIEEAKKAINFEKMKAMTDIKNEIANLSIDIAEKLIRKELSDKDKQEQLIEEWMKEINLN